MAKAWNNRRTNYALCPSIQIRPSLTHISATPDSASRCSIQGDSDSETEVISTISTNLDSMLSSDSSDIEFSDDDAFEDAEKPVFLTARGPIRVDSGQSLHGLPLGVLSFLFHLFQLYILICFCLRFFSCVCCIWNYSCTYGFFLLPFQCGVFGYVYVASGSKLLFCYDRASIFCDMCIIIVFRILCIYLIFFCYMCLVLTFDCHIVFIKMCNLFIVIWFLNNYINILNNSYGVVSYVYRCFCTKHCILVCVDIRFNFDVVHAIEKVALCLLLIITYFFMYSQHA